MQFVREQKRYSVVRGPLGVILKTVPRLRESLPVVAIAAPAQSMPSPGRLPAPRETWCPHPCPTCERPNGWPGLHRSLRDQTITEERPLTKAISGASGLPSKSGARYPCGGYWPAAGGNTNHAIGISGMNSPGLSAWKRTVMIWSGGAGYGSGRNSGANSGRFIGNG